MRGLVALERVYSTMKCQLDLCEERTESKTGYCWRHRTEASRPGYRPEYRIGTKSEKKKKPLRPPPKRAR